jgi:hypothetical protein
MHKLDLNTDKRLEVLDIRLQQWANILIFSARTATETITKIVFGLDLLKQSVKVSEGADVSCIFHWPHKYLFRLCGKKYSVV